MKQALTHPLEIILMLAGIVVLAGFLTSRASAACKEPSYAHERTDWTTRELGRNEAREWVVRARPYALMSELAYQGSSVAADAKRTAIQKLFRDDLKKEGWTLLTDRVDITTVDEDSPGLHFYVWEKNAGTQRTLTLAFRGTESWDAKDWEANSRWFRFFSRKNDQYVQARQLVFKYLQNHLTPADTNVSIVVTGHSLGGGIAQGMFWTSYGFPAHVHITQCYAFDPSPVTGALQLGTSQERKRAVLARNARQKKIAGDKVRGESSLNHFELGIARIYEQGEVLSFIRGPLRRLWPLHSLITEVRFDLANNGNSINQHAMLHIAKALYDKCPTDCTPAPHP